MNREQYQEQVETMLSVFPPFMKDWNRELVINEISYATIYQYFKTTREFFSWLLESGVLDYSKIKDIKPTDLNIDKNTANDYKYYLRERPRQSTYGDVRNAASAKNADNTLTTKTINNKLSALLSLYRYLTEDVEIDGDVYFDRNAFKKAGLLKDKEAKGNQRNKDLVRQMFLGDIKFDFLDWAKNRYPESSDMKPQQKKTYKRDIERNLAIFALILGSGIRVNELVSADVDAIEFKKNGGEIRVLRKGGFTNTAFISQWAIPYIRDYLDIRNARYNPQKSQKALFLAFSRTDDHANRITVSAVQRMWKKWSTAFGRPSTPHKGRHTFATELYNATSNIVLVADALGQSTTSATTKYTHILDGEISDVVANLNAESNDSFPSISVYEDSASKVNELI